MGESERKTVGKVGRDSGWLDRSRNTVCKLPSIIKFLLASILAYQFKVALFSFRPTESSKNVFSYIKGNDFSRQVAFKLRALISNLDNCSYLLLIFDFQNTYDFCQIYNKNPFDDKLSSIVRDLIVITGIMKF